MVEGGLVGGGAGQGSLDGGEEVDCFGPALLVEDEDAGLGAESLLMILLFSICIHTEKIQKKYEMIRGGEEREKRKYLLAVSSANHRDDIFKLSAVCAPSTYHVTFSSSLTSQRPRNTVPSSPSLNFFGRADSLLASVRRPSFSSAASARAIASVAFFF